MADRGDSKKRAVRTKNAAPGKTSRVVTSKTKTPLTKKKPAAKAKPVKKKPAAKPKAKTPLKKKPAAKPKAKAHSKKKPVAAKPKAKAPLKKKPVAKPKPRPKAKAAPAKAALATKSARVTQQKHVAKGTLATKSAPVAKQKPVASNKAKSSLPGPRAAPLATPSERVLAARGERPTERSLTDDEREAMAKVSETARRFVGVEGDPSVIIQSIAGFLDDVRRGRRDEPRSQDVRLGLGVLWGEQLRAQVGWRWVHLSYPDGFASYALVPDDRAFACFPLNRVPDTLKGVGTNTTAHVFESIREGDLPRRARNAYLIIG